MPNTPDGPDRYCTTCGWFPETEDDDVAIGCACPSCGVGPVVASTPSTIGAPK